MYEQILRLSHAVVKIKVYRETKLCLQTDRQDGFNIPPKLRLQLFKNLFKCPMISLTNRFHINGICFFYGIRIRKGTDQKKQSKHTDIAITMEFHIQQPTVGSLMLSANCFLYLFIGLSAGLRSRS